VQTLPWIKFDKLALQPLWMDDSNAVATLTSSSCDACSSEGPSLKKSRFSLFAPTVVPSTLAVSAGAGAGTCGTREVSSETTPMSCKKSQYLLDMGFKSCLC
jgi:hypothetical protein